MPKVVRASGVEHTGITATDRRRIERLERRPSGGGFDPNEDPVIIGAGAATNDGGTPSNPTTAHLAVIVIGNTASGRADYVIAHGYHQIVSGVRAVGIGYDGIVSGQDAAGIGSFLNITGQQAFGAGWGATASGFGDTACGSSAHSSGGYGFSGGYQARATADSATAVGTASASAYASSSAFGAGSVTDTTNQIMFGTSSETVVFPGLMEVRALPTADPGVSGQVWNNSGVLTVSP